MDYYNEFYNDCINKYNQNTDIDIEDIEAMKEQITIINVKIKTEKYILSCEQIYSNVFKRSLDYNHITNIKYDMLMGEMKDDMIESNAYIRSLYIDAIKLSLLIINKTHK
jgi:hypothetical protein